MIWRVASAFAAFIAASASLLLWASVAQREHYAPGRIAKIALLWLKFEKLNQVTVIAGCAVAATSLLWYWTSPIAALILALWPLGLIRRGGHYRLAWTNRARRLLGLLAIIAIAIGAAVANEPILAVLVVLTPLLVDVALYILLPVERRLSLTFVRRATMALRRTQAREIAITGSYGKTSTKSYVAHLLSARFNLLATPGSFNNLLGLSRSLNEGLTPDTEVFVAEMGTYGPGEIREMCGYFPPDIAAITTIGDAHLERMGSRAVIARAKAEITETAPVVVLNIDSPELALLAEELSASKNVTRTSAIRPDADVAVVPRLSQWVIYIEGREFEVIRAPTTGHASNFAVAIGIALAAGQTPEAIRSLLDHLPSVEHRAEVYERTDGITMIDDTFNSNLRGASAALRIALTARTRTGTVWYITPGMFELGREQEAQNRELAAIVCDRERDTMLLAVGATNRRALTSGRKNALTFDSRVAARNYVEGLASSGDVIVYENDLPFYYP